jgi:hypothetical protein
MGLRAALAFLLCNLGATGGLAASGVCMAAAHDAAARHQVPPAVLVTIARAESGFGPDRQPWAWTLNAAGKGQHFATPQALLKTLRARREAGETNLDIGCFQLNFRWHSHSFTSLEEMIDPARNADHAARFLRALYDETGSWKAAAGAYHSRKPSLAANYVARLERIFGQHPPQIPPEAPKPTKARPGAEATASPQRPEPILAPRPPLAMTPRAPISGAGA